MVTAARPAASGDGIEARIARAPPDPVVGRLCVLALTAAEARLGRLAEPPSTSEPVDVNVATIDGASGAIRAIGASGVAAAGALSMTSVDPESPPIDRPNDDPELPVWHSREIEPQVLVRLMAQVPVPPEVTIVEELPPAPGVALAKSPLPALPEAGPDAISTNAEPDEPPVAVPAAGPELPVMQITDTVATTFTK